ncbi:hypothetical protein ACLOJK_003519 [Asimina triloba]
MRARRYPNGCLLVCDSGFLARTQHATPGPIPTPPKSHLPHCRFLHVKNSLTRVHASHTGVHHPLSHVCQSPHISFPVYKNQSLFSAILSSLHDCMQKQRAACIRRDKSSNNTMISYCILPTTSKTDEIMSRYRPIAPKPQLPPHSLLDGSPDAESPFLTRALSSLQKTRSTRARKRAKTCNSTAAQKRPKIRIIQQQPSSLDSCLAKHTQLPLFEHGLPCFPYPPSPRLPDSPPGGGDSASISLLLYTPSSDVSAADGFHLSPSVEEQAINLNCKAEAMEAKNLLQKVPASMGSPAVIVPQPVRPVGSSISVGCISKPLSSTSSAPVLKRPEEVEEEVELEALPSVVSDSNNRVRLANSAYKAMLGQPECPWLDSMVAKDGSRVGTTSKRISGEVMLDLSHTSVPMPANRFSCWVKIEWASNGRNMFVDAPCDVTRLSCESKDYLFTWRFLITDMRPQE